jgi:NAD(P)-dependent dehydrogenase (short-subunit alcohol dehydrogenase family)
LPALEGRAAVVTGAGSGIGRAVVEAFVAEGASVVAFDRSAERLEALAGARVRTVAGDVRSRADNERAAAECLSSFGRLDTFVGNAGLFDGNARLDELEDVEGAFAEIYGVNVLGYLLGARACLAGLQENGGTIVFTVSNSAFHAGSGGGILYASSKSAVAGIVRQLAWELAPRIRVNGVSPGGTITDLRIGDAFGRDDTRHFADRERAEHGIRSTNPLGVLPTAEDHAPLYVLLASDASRVITGTIVHSDGGLDVRGVRELR